MLDDKFLAQANNLLKEAKEKLLFGLDDDGQPKCSMSELIDFWDRVNAHLKETN